MTVDEPRLRVTTNLAFGICLVLLGTVLILDRLQLAAASQLLQFWPVALALIGLAMVIQSFQRVDSAAPPAREVHASGTSSPGCLSPHFFGTGSRCGRRDELMRASDPTCWP